MPRAPPHRPRRSVEKTLMLYSPQASLLHRRIPFLPPAQPGTPTCSRFAPSSHSRLPRAGAQFLLPLTAPKPVHEALSEALPMHRPRRRRSHSLPGPRRRDAACPGFPLFPTATPRSLPPRLPAPCLSGNLHPAPEASRLTLPISSIPRCTLGPPPEVGLSHPLPHRGAIQRLARPPPHLAAQLASPPYLLEWWTPPGTMSFRARPLRAPL